MRHPRVLVIDQRCQAAHLGDLPLFLDLDDPRPAAEQFQERYVYGGWHPQKGFTNRNGTATLYFAGDPPFEPLAVMRLRDEMVFVYQHAYVAIFQDDGTFEVCRMD